MWKHRDFMLLWVGQTISQFGSQVTAFALPLIAALTLEVSPAQMGALIAIETAPFLLFSFVAGVWVDRLRRRPILIIGDLGRALLLLLVPLLAILGQLNLAWLYLVGFAVGVLRVFFDIAYQSILPSLVAPEQLVESNSKLEVSASVATIAGPGLAGFFVQVLTAPIALVADALSFLVSAIALLGIRTPESVATQEARQGFWAEIAAGLRVVGESPVLRAVAACTGTWNCCGNIWFAVYVLYATGDLGISPVTLGIAYSLGSIGALLGATFSGVIRRAFGPGGAIIGAALVGTVSAVLVPLVGAPGFLAVAAIVLVGFGGGFGNAVYRINQVSLRQALVPAILQGRMNATMRFIGMSVIPIGALLGGALGESIGLRPTLVLGSIGLMIAPLWLYCSPLRSRATVERLLDGRGMVPDPGN